MGRGPLRETGQRGQIELNMTAMALLLASWPIGALLVVSLGLFGIQIHLYVAIASTVLVGTSA